LEKLAKNAGAMTASIEDARRRTRAVTKKLKGMETLEPLHANRLLALEEEEGASI
jgi:DNA anti-recombination protein RmuC